MAALVGLIFVIIGLIIWQRDLFASINLLAVRTFIQGFGALAVLVYIVLLAVNTVTVMPPTAILIFSAGVLFPFVEGVIALWTGQFLGSILAFMIARYFAQDFVSQRITGRVGEFNDQLKEKGFSVVFFARLVGLPPYEFVNYASGSSKISFRDFALASALGPIPGVFIFVLTGDRLLNFNLRDPLIYVLPVFVVITYMLSKIVSRIRSRNHED